MTIRVDLVDKGDLSVHSITEGSTVYDNRQDRFLEFTAEEIDADLNKYRPVAWKDVTGFEEERYIQGNNREEWLRQIKEGIELGQTFPGWELWFAQVRLA